MRITAIDIEIADDYGDVIAVLHCQETFMWSPSSEAETRTLANAIRHAIQNLTWQNPEDQLEDYWRAVYNAFGEGALLSYKRMDEGATIIVEDADGWTYDASIDIEKE